MTDLLQRKQAILDYIVINLDEDDFNQRLQDKRRIFGPLEILHGFHDFQSFLNFQVAMVNRTDENNLPTLEFFKDFLIPRARLFGSRQELVLTAGFAFDSDGNFIFKYDKW